MIARPDPWILNSQGDAHCGLAEALAAAGRADEADAGFEQAFDRYGRKKNLAMLAQMRPKVEKLRRAGAGLTLPVRSSELLAVLGRDSR